MFVAWNKMLTQHEDAQLESKLRPHSHWILRNWNDPKLGKTGVYWGHLGLQINLVFCIDCNCTNGNHKEL